MWYFDDLARSKAEREGLERLEANADWLTAIVWRFDGMKLVFDADIAVGARLYPVTLTYPAHFPHTPPSVYPRDDKTRWSAHQFGAGGELCLEYGPDNWTPDRTGVDLLESAYRLLSTERPETGDPCVVASRHETTLGQDLRAEFLRLFVTRSFRKFMDEMEIGPGLKGSQLLLYRESCVYIVESLTVADGEVWRDPSVPTNLRKETYERPFRVARIAPDLDFPTSTDVATFNSGLERLGLINDCSGFVLIRGDEIRGFAIFPESILDLVTVLPPPKARRLDEAHEKLRHVRVAIIGCGSLGSKIATMLARSGVSRFFLADDDVLLEDNLVRHDLDWRDMGSHKADALASRLRDVNPGTRVTVRKLRIAGQESSGSAETAIDSLSERDLIIDATANPAVFNLLAGLMESAKKPVLWAEVFGGGFAGLIARCRPGIEPPLQLMRRSIENWFGDRDYKPERAARSYEIGAAGAPMTADDADVTAIAAPAARLAIDTLLGRDPSHFPHSAYVIGLAPDQQLITQAFDTFPIDVGTPPAPTEKPELSQEEARAEVAGIVKIIAKQ